MDSTTIVINFKYYLDVGKVLNIAKGEPFKYRNVNMRIEGTEVGYHRIKDLEFGKMI